jgi:tetratricopeptide (TPR) repeat protein
MAKRNRKTKQTDDTLIDIVEVRDQAKDFLGQYQNIIFGVVTGLVVVIGGYLAFKNFYQEPRNKEALSQMFQAELQFERDSFAAALTNPGGGYSGFLDIIDNYGGTAAGNVAKYYAGISYLNLGRYQEAVDLLESFKAKGSISPAMKNGALGDAYSELGNLSKARNFYKKAAEATSNELLTPYYLLKLGMLDEKNGNATDAVKAYKRIQTEFPESIQAASAIKYLGKFE